jgi:hypothetical protein
LVNLNELFLLWIKSAGLCFETISRILNTCSPPMVMINV